MIASELQVVMDDDKAVSSLISCLLCHVLPPVISWLPCVSCDPVSDIHDFIVWRGHEVHSERSPRVLLPSQTKVTLPHHFFIYFIAIYCNDSPRSYLMNVYYSSLRMKWEIVLLRGYNMIWYSQVVQHFCCAWEGKYAVFYKLTTDIIYGEIL